MRKLILFCIAAVCMLNAKAQQPLTPDTIISVNADFYCRADKDQLFEFSDGSKAFQIFSYDTMTVSSAVNDTNNYSVVCPDFYRVLYVVDSNYQFKQAITIKQTQLFQVGDTLYGTANALWGQSFDLNPAGTPVIISGTSNPNRNVSYLVAYDKNLQLVNHSLINTNVFSSANIRAIENGKIYAITKEKDDHPVNGSFAMGRQNFQTYDMNFNLLNSHTYYSRQGTWYSFDLLQYFKPSANGGFYGYFTSGSVGEDFDIGLNGQPAIRPYDRNALGYLAKYDANLNLLWDSRITFGNSPGIVGTNRIYDSPTGDSLLWVGLTGAENMYYQQGSTIDTLVGDTSYSFNEYMLTLDKNTGNFQRFHSADLDNIYGNGTQMLRFAVSSKSSFTGTVTSEYLNFLDNTFPVPDSNAAIAIYDDATTGIPTSYRMLGYLAPTHNYSAYAMLNSTLSNSLYIAGRYANAFNLDSSWPYTLPDFNNTSSLFLGAFGVGTITGAPAPLSNPSEFTFFPNPSTDYIQIDVVSPKAKGLRILNLEGKVMESRSLKGRTAIRIETSHLPVGMYFLEVDFGQGERIGKRFIRK